MDDTVATGRENAGIPAAVIIGFVAVIAFFCTLLVAIAAPGRLAEVGAIVGVVGIAVVTFFFFASNI